MSKKRRAKIPPFRVLNSENIFRKFVSKIMRSCDKNFAQLHLYSGDTILRILKKYIADLRISAVQKHNEVDLVHCNFLIQIMKLLEHNDFLTSQSQKIREFYKYMAQEYPYLSFTFKGRIKSLIRAEGKFNGYIVEYIYDYYEKNGSYPSVSEIKERLNCFRDLIAYRIVISMPRCHMKQKQDRKKEEIRYLYRIANVLPQFLEERGFTAEPTGGVKRSNSLLLDDAVRPYYRDYIDGESTNSYRSLHITFFDNSARCYMEMQLRTKEMDDIAEIGVANHLFYEKKQETSRGRRDAILQGGCIYFDEAYERCRLLQDLDLSGVDVNMFTAVNNSLMNDGSGLLRGRMILPYELYKKFKIFKQNLYNLSKNEEKYHLKLHDWRLPSQIVIIELQSASVFGGRTRDKQ